MSKIVLKLALTLLGLGCALSLQAQTVTGTVREASGEPAIGAVVMLQGTGNGTSTDMDGHYSISVPDTRTAVLEISLIGMATQTVPVSGRSVVDVVLTEDTTFLDEVVVVGYATVKRRDLLGSVSSVGSEKLTEQPVTTVSQALAGKMAGVSVMTTEGDPDADIKIRVRGGGSITQDSSPLYIVDGFPVESINDISASEIASIDVLKDAFSTAIYGSRGANGVVIVTTKSADKGQKVSVKFNSYWGQKKMANPEAIQVMDTENFVKAQYELHMLRDDVSSQYNPYFGSFADIDLYSGLPGSDWIGQVFGNVGSTFSTDLSVSGSNEHANWTLGYAHLDDQAIMLGSNYARNNLNFKGQFKTSARTRFDLNVRYSQTDVRGSGANSINDAGTNSGNGRLKHAVMYSPIPIVSATNPDDEETFGDNNTPPVRSVWDNDSRKTRTTWTGNAAFSWDIVDNLTLKVEGGIENWRETTDRFYGMTTYFVYNSNRPGPATMYTDITRTRYRNTNTLNYDFSKLIGNSDHSLTALVGEEMTITKLNTFSATALNFPLAFSAEDSWNFMSTGEAANLGNVFSADDKLLSFFGRINYDYKHKYSLGATLRADGSSKFAKGNRWGFFPSAAASWTISNEDWMAGTHGWLEQLKLRYSFGTAGNNNIPSGQMSKNFSAYNGGNIVSDWIMAGTFWLAGSVMENPDLRWETTYTHNIGLDFSVLKGRINGSVEVYQNDTKDLLINFPITGSGYDTQYRNIGSTRNRGAELTLNMPIIQKKDISLNLSGNIAYNRNEVTSLGGLDMITGRSVQSYWASTEIGDDYLVQAGKPLGNMYGYVYDGIYTVDDFDCADGKWILKEGVTSDSKLVGDNFLRPGAIKLLDLDGDYQITEKDKKVIGNASPDFLGGFSLNGYFFGFDFSANFNYMIGNDVYNANKVEFTTSRKFNNRNLLKSMELDNRWTSIDWNTGEFIDDPAALAAANQGKEMFLPYTQNAIFSDWAVEDASFLRLQSATLGYTLPENLTMKAHLRKVRVYITGTNLFCLTGYSGYDPEVDTRRSTPLTPGVDYSAYPKSTGYVVGLNITF